MPEDLERMGRRRGRADHPGKDPETELMFITWSNTPVGAEIG
jgi:hypothetical protein